MPDPCPRLVSGAAGGWSLWFPSLQPFLAPLEVRVLN